MFKFNKNILLAIIGLSILFMFYNINDVWKDKDHYNYGGINHTQLVECMEKLPLSVTKGISVKKCEEGQPFNIYPNWSAATYIVLAQYRILVGSQEPWTTRTFFIFFCLLNLILVYKISEKIFAGSHYSPLLVTAVNAGTVFTLMYSSHSDYVSFFSAFFLNLALFSVLNGGHPLLSGLLGLVAGSANWIGFFFFPAWSIYDYLKNRKLFNWINFFWGPIAMVSGLALMMWLHQKTSIFDFIKMKATNPGYAHSGGLTYFIDWIYTFIQTQSRFLHPVTASLMIFGVYLVLFKKTFAAQKEIWMKLVFIAVPGLIFSILGHQFVYNHSFQYHPMMLIFSILAAVGVHHIFNFKIDTQGQRVLMTSLLVFVLFYPYGAYKSIFWLDIVNSLLIATCGFVFVWAIKGNRKEYYGPLLALAFLANLAQFINYRNEPPIDYEFCQKARAEFAETKQPVKTGGRKTDALEYYCRGIPLDFN